MMRKSEIAHRLLELVRKLEPDADTEIMDAYRAMYQDIRRGHEVDAEALVDDMISDLIEAISNATYGLHTGV